MFRESPIQKVWHISDQRVCAGHGAGVDGLVAALVAAPSFVRPDKWIPLIFGGRPNEAKPFVEKAMQVDPLNPAYSNFLRGMISFCEADYSTAIEYFQTALKQNPDDFGPAAPMAAGRPMLRAEARKSVDRNAIAGQSLAMADAMKMESLDAVGVASAASATGQQPGGLADANGDLDEGDDLDDLDDLDELDELDDLDEDVAATVASRRRQYDADIDDDLSVDGGADDGNVREWARVPAADEDFDGDDEAGADR
jgi:tetratricopeptide (TPR) repeat protein